MKNLFYIGLTSFAFTICSRATAQEAPVIVNPETGAVVNLTRAYWDANVDIANKRMQCDYFSFDAETGVFEKARAFFGNPSSDISTLSTQFSHAPLPNDTRQANIAGVLSDGPGGDTRTDRYSNWSVVDGRYQGPAPLATSAFAETVAFNASIDNAVRFWFQNEPFAAYSVCYDLDGMPLLPTGTVGSSNTQLVDLPDFTFDTPNVYESIPEIINRETGETVEITRGRWSYNKDIASSSLTCLNARWNGQSYEQDGNSALQYVYFPYNGGDFVPTTFLVTDTERFPSIGNQNTTSFTLPDTNPDFDSYMEITEYGYRMWGEGGGGYRACIVGVSGVGFTSVGFTQEIKPFGPTEFLPLTADAAPLVVTDDCDYTDADDFDGYGFDPVTMFSCPPLGNENSADDATDTADNIQDTGTTEGADIMQTNPTSVNNAPDDSTVSSDDNTTVQITNDVQTNTATTDNSSNDSTSNSDDATTAENENTAVEDEVVASNSQADSTDTDLVSSDETTTSSSGGGSFWLPILMLALAFRRPMRALQKQ